MTTPEIELHSPAASEGSVARAVGSLLRFLHRYSFSFALGLTLVLLIVNLIRTPNFGWSDQLHTPIL